VQLKEILLGMTNLHFTLQNPAIYGTANDDSFIHLTRPSVIFEVGKVNLFEQFSI
jgi:hypothetical protein